MGNENPSNKKGGKHNLYKPISSAVNATANAKPCLSTIYVYTNKMQLMFKRIMSLRLSMEKSLVSADVISGKRGQLARDIVKAAVDKKIWLLQLSSGGNNDADADNEKVPMEEIADMAGPPG
jgi:hypothetical protein